jgi:hypothetical protein
MLPKVTANFAGRMATQLTYANKSFTAITAESRAVLKLAAHINHRKRNLKSQLFLLGLAGAQFDGLTLGFIGAIKRAR